jgi:hypothetical protein
MLPGTVSDIGSSKSLSSYGVLTGSEITHGRGTTGVLSLSSEDCSIDLESCRKSSFLLTVSRSDCLVITNSPSACPSFVCSVTHDCWIKVVRTLSIHTDNNISCK